MNENLTKALRLCGVRVEPRELELILRLNALIDHKGEDATLKDITQIEQEVNEQFKK